ncbi:MAG: bifunctional oligoribonuclease/PAP phosphatase NrnA [Desulfovibrionaceae bacterium]
MALFRQLDEQIASLHALLAKDQRWLIVINADPDALGAAMALKRIMGRKVLDVGIGQVNECKRPDNLAMIRYLRIPTRKIIPNLLAQYDRFALIDSQPHHHPGFAGIDFSVVIDHHPLLKEHPVKAPFTDIRPKYGATCTMMTEYLYNLDIRPGKLLATALTYAIKTDTADWEREFIDADITAFKYLLKFADRVLLNRIAKSEFHLDWMRYFSRAFYNLRRAGTGIFSHMGKVDNPDILVILADFFTRVHGVPWNVVSGETGDKLVIILRGDGVRRDMGKYAASLFGDLGTAGGHRNAARAEIPLENLKGEDPELFLFRKLGHGNGRPPQRI